MKVLWLCNVMLPAIAEQLNMEGTNKEGWITGLADNVLKNDNGIELAIAFPAPNSMFPKGHEVCLREIAIRGKKVPCYGFMEDTTRAEKYDAGLEQRLRRIVENYQPHVIHCFGTEYPHTLAMCRVCPEPSRILIGIQGLCAVYAEAYLANLPEEVIHTATFRDRLRRDSILQQREKFVLRGRNEIEAIGLAGNITGRTGFDRFYAEEWNPKARYFHMNETLRRDFYENTWKYEDCEPYSIFVSQGDYPIKGLHYLLKAMPAILERYPEAKVYVAGNSIVNYASIKDKIKISAYGKYLLELIGENGLQERIVFLGKLTGSQMKEQYLKSHLYVCCSTMENSPNSLGEAMLLGMPCVSSDVGGISGIFNDGEDGILYKGFRSSEIKYQQDDVLGKTEEEKLDMISRRLAKAVLETWSDEERMNRYCEQARRHALMNHNGEQNYNRLIEIYREIDEKA